MSATTASAAQVHSTDGATATRAPAATETQIPANGKIGAFFDVDNTMIMGASIYHFARGLAARKFFTTRDLARFAGQQLRFRMVGKENLSGLDRTQETALAFVADREVAEIQRYGEEIYDDLIADRIWPGTLGFAEEHLSRGEQVWLVTATPAELANVIASRLQLTGALGTVAEVANGRYTGRLVGELLHGASKAHAIKALAERENLDLARSSAYSDSINDLPLLTSVGHPVAINPDRQLRRYAKAQGWPVHDFRRARKAVSVGVPGIAGAGALLAGAFAVGIAVRRHRDRP